MTISVPVMKEEALFEASMRVAPVSSLAVPKRGLGGGEESGDEGVDADVVLCPCAGEVFGEVVDGGFGRRVGADAGNGHGAGHGADVDDAARLVVVDEELAEDLAGAEGAFEVDVQHSVEFLVGDFEEGGAGTCSGSVDEDVYFSRAEQYGGEEVFDVAALADVGFVEPGLAADGIDGGEFVDGVLRVAPDEDDFGSGACEGNAHAAAEVAGAAGDDGDLAAEVKEGCDVLHAWRVVVARGRGPRSAS